MCVLSSGGLHDLNLSPDGLPQRWSAPNETKSEKVLLKWGKPWIQSHQLIIFSFFLWNACFFQGLVMGKSPMFKSQTSCGLSLSPGAGTSLRRSCFSLKFSEANVPSPSWSRPMSWCAYGSYGTYGTYRSHGIWLLAALQGLFQGKCTGDTRKPLCYHERWGICTIQGICPDCKWSRPQNHSLPLVMSPPANAVQLQNPVPQHLYIYIIIYI